MRLQQLSLLRFGKFTDTELSLPPAEHDFHLIIGPNEAGKSTVRSAIADLLFGFPMRYQAMAFVHPQPDLRLGAVVSAGTEHLAFVRTKGNRNTLRTPTDTPLPDDALTPFVGQADRAFFETMFGLGHEQLVKGGASILDASKDVSQVLFQSAAGIAGLGRVHQGLLDEADTLWAPRRANSRAYYQAHDQFEQANKALKIATGRTKSWTEVRQKLTDIEAALVAVTAQKEALQVQRLQLERIRRWAPRVSELKRKQAEWESLGPVLALPANAAEIQSRGEQALSVAETTLRQCERTVEQLTQQRDAVVLDTHLLAAKDRIQALAACGESVRNHAAGLRARQEEIQRHLERARTAAAALGWPQDAEAVALRARLPEALVLREVQRRVNEHSGLRQHHTATAQSVADKRAELALAEHALQGIRAVEVSAALRNALAEAQAFRNTTATQAKLDSAVKAAQRALASAQAALSPWHPGAQALPLAQMSVPSRERLAALTAQQQRLESECRAADDRVDDTGHAHQKAVLAVKHFTETHHSVTLADVLQARAQRNTLWQAIKHGQTPLSVGAQDLEAAITLADALEDRLRDSSTDAAELQSLRQQVERAEAEHTAALHTQARQHAERARFDAQWQALTQDLGLSGLVLEDAPAWLAKRELALSAHTTLAEKVDELQQEVDAATAVQARLEALMAQAGVGAPPQSPLPALIAQAEAFVTAADSALARQTQLIQQRDSDAAALGRLQAAADTARAQWEAWQMQWHAAIDAAGLSACVRSVEDAEQALANVGTVQESLDKAADLQRSRIDTMHRDLDAFQTMADDVVAELGLSALQGLPAKEIVQVLQPQLQEAEAAQARRAAAEQSLSAALAERHAAQQQVEQVQAQVAPLLHAAGVDSLSAAAPLVAQFDAKRQLAHALEHTRTALTQDADGLGLEAVIAACEACDLSQVAVELTRCTDSLEHLQQEHTRLAVERTEAQRAVDAFGGGWDAAQAEAQKQEALSAMADATERYIKVTAAAKLLGWAIERYRERNQGPLLTRAGAIFATLTLGRFERLLVDFESAPPQLTALRADGQTVEVPGLSEGTRDQLYLALRLAALEVHLAKAPALPFVADDLFINFDDERSTAGLTALRELSRHTQVLFLSHHEHLLPRVEQVFGAAVNVVRLRP